MASRAEVMPDVPESLKALLARSLAWEEAHIALEEAARRIPAARRGTRPRGLPHSPWEILEHVRIAQRDLLDFATRADYRKMEWPRDYWPPSPKPPGPRAWAASLRAIAEDRAALRRLVEAAPDLMADVPSAPGKSILRGVLLALDHMAYHVGGLVVTAQLLARR